MARRIDAFVLVAFAILLGGVAAISDITPLATIIPLGTRHTVVLHAYDGRFRAFYIQSSEELLVTHNDVRPAIEMSSPRSGFPGAWLRAIDPHDVLPPSWETHIRIGNSREVRDFGFAWQSPLRDLLGGRTPVIMSYMRTPAWIVLLVLLIRPVAYIIRVPFTQRRRRRHNQCVDCGYRLKGLPRPRCPECGRTVDWLTDTTPSRNPSRP